MQSISYHCAFFHLPQVLCPRIFEALQLISVRKLLLSPYARAQ